MISMSQNKSFVFWNIVKKKYVLYSLMYFDKILTGLDGENDSKF